jgi:hypothetical protein
MNKHIWAWKAIGAPLTVLNWLSDGISIPFSSIPEPFEFNNFIFESKKESFVREEIKRLFKCGYIVECYNKPEHISPIGCVPKKTGGYRLITDFRHLNSFCTPCKFKQEDIRNVEQVVKEKDFFTSIDLKDGFYHVPVNKDYQKYFSFYFEGKYYSYVVLPFGFSLSPYFFAKVLRPVVTYLRSLNIRLSLYVDDFLICAEVSKITDSTDQTLHTLEDLGFKINLDKSVLKPTQTIDYLGYTISTVGPYPVIKAQKQRILRIKKQIRSVLKAGRASARVLAKTAGLCVSVAWAVTPGKLFLRQLYHLLASRQSWNDVLCLNEACREELQWWLDAIDDWNYKEIQIQNIDVQLETDASQSGWGAYLEGLCAKGDWNKRVSCMPSNYRELLAILMALLAFKTLLQGKTVQILTDNVTSAAYINHKGGPSVVLSQLATAVWATAMEYKISLTCRHIAGVTNIYADRLSREPDVHNWMLHPKLFSLLEQRWGPHTVDRFASLLTAQLPRFNTRFWEPLSEGVDAFAQCWTQENNYVNPPWALLPQVINKVIQDRAVATIIAPEWPGQPWFQTLRSIMIALPMYLPKHQQTFHFMGPNPEPRKNHRWTIAAWRVSGRLV